MHGHLEDKVDQEEGEVPLKPRGLGVRGVNSRSHLSPGCAHGGPHLGTAPGNPEALVRNHGRQISWAFTSPLTSPHSFSSNPETGSLVKINWENVICIV